MKEREKVRVGEEEKYRRGELFEDETFGKSEKGPILMRIFNY